MRTEIRIAGFGGQGVVLAGLLLGEAAIRDGKYAVQTQSYGPESRGGASRSEVVISNQEIDYPKVIEADILVVLSQIAYDRYRSSVKRSGTTIIDSDLVEGEGNNLHSVPFIRIADNLGKKVVANSVMIGYLLASTEMISIDTMETTIRETVPEQTIDLNMKALQRGIQFWKTGE